MPFRNVLCRALALILLLGAASPASAHADYDRNPAASACCGGADCRPLDAEDVAWDEDAKGWRVRWDDDVVFVPRESALPSPDEAFHGCGNRTRGLFGATGPLPPGAAAELEPWRICFLAPADAMAAAYPEQQAAGVSALTAVLSHLSPARRSPPAPMAVWTSAPWPGGTAGGEDARPGQDRDPESGAAAPRDGDREGRPPETRLPDPRLPIPPSPVSPTKPDSAVVPLPPAAGLLLVAGAALLAVRRLGGRGGRSG